MVAVAVTGGSSEVAPLRSDTRLLNSDPHSHVSAYDLMCRIRYDLMCRSVFGELSPFSP